MFKRILIIFIILDATQFFSLSIFSDFVIKIFDVISIILFITIICYYKFQELVLHKNFNKGIFKREILIILFAVFFSFFGAAIYHNQSLLQSFISSRFMYFYLLYFVLIKFDLRTHELEKIVMIFSVTYSIIYFAAALNPTIVSVRIYEDFFRQTIRVYMPGILLVIFSFFNHISRFFEEKKFIDLLLFILFLTLIIHTGTRMVIFPSLLIVLIFIGSRLKFYKSILIVTLSTILIIIVFYPILKGTFNLLLSEKNYSEPGGTLSIRLQAINYFFNLLFPTFITYIIGNGFASYHNNYGNFILFLREKYNLYQSDIGIIGDYTRFGILFVVGILALLIKICKHSYAKNAKYIKYFFIFIGITYITIPHFGNSDGIVAICCGLYLIEKYNDEKNQELF